MGHDSTTTNLEVKRAFHDLQGESTASDDDDEPNLMPPGSTTTFKDELGTQRISRRPIIIIKSSSHNQNLLHFKDEPFDLMKQEPDELLAIPILPADEMDSLTWEIRLWNSSLRCVRIIFSCGIFSTLVLAIITIVYSVYWYKVPAETYDTHYREGSTYYNFHMCGQLTNIFLMFLGSMLFRILPRTELRKLIWMHAITLQLAFGICVAAVVCSIIGHKQFTSNEAHLYSLHSWVGLLAFVFYLSSLVTGWMFLYHPSRTLQAHHSTYGKVALSLFGLVSLMGYYERSFELLHKQYKVDPNHEPEGSRPFPIPLLWANIIGIFFLVVCTTVRVGLVNFAFRRQPKPQWDVIVFRSIQEIEDIYVEVHDSYDSYELWVKQVNFTKLQVLQAAFVFLDDDADED